MAEYKFETDEETLKFINSVEAKLGLTHEEFVEKAAQFADAQQSTFERHAIGDER